MWRRRLAFTLTTECNNFVAFIWGWVGFHACIASAIVQCALMLLSYTWLLLLHLMNQCVVHMHVFWVNIHCIFQHSCCSLHWCSWLLMWYDDAHHQCCNAFGIEYTLWIHEINFDVCTHRCIISCKSVQSQCIHVAYVECWVFVIVHNKIVFIVASVAPVAPTHGTPVANVQQHHNQWRWVRKNPHVHQCIVHCDAPCGWIRAVRTSIHCAKFLVSFVVWACSCGYHKCCESFGNWLDVGDDVHVNDWWSVDAAALQHVYVQCCNLFIIVIQQIIVYAVIDQMVDALNACIHSSWSIKLLILLAANLNLAATLLMITDGICMLWRCIQSLLSIATGMSL